MNTGPLRSFLGLTLVALTLNVFAGAKTEHVSLETNKGVIELELYPDKAPVSVANFLKYVDSGFYNGVIFHRVVPGFVIQAGGYDVKMTHRQPAATIVNESTNHLHNTKGTVAMARLQDPNSASSQFFINVADNDNLDFHPGAPGYAVFGRVTAGMDVVDRIADVATADVDGMANVPTEPVVILSARRSQ
jgi:peptidyl-prolyl cis-trans isomerase A (cyclophilin A)